MEKFGVLVMDESPLIKGTHVQKFLKINNPVLEL
jgi:hypothetical protein